jgi:ribonuclease HII
MGAAQDGSPNETITWIGIDEAGYAPNLGPLVVTATVWESIEAVEAPLSISTVRVPRLDPAVLWRRLAPVVGKMRAASAARASGRSAENGRRLYVDDSKKLYSPVRGLGVLERGVLCLLGVEPSPQRTFRSLLEATGAHHGFFCDPSPWFDGCDVALPVAAEVGDVLAMTRRVTQKMARAGLTLRAVHSDVVSPARLNALIAKYDSKGAALAEVTSGLLERAISSSDLAADSPALALVDRQGGRKFYRPMLQHTFPDDLVVCVDETPTASWYRLSANGRPLEVCFQVGGERHLPVALASMVSKYLRELAMILFNRFWAGHVPDLRPTAGYPLDARRFANAIRAKQRELGIADDLLWRVR